MTEYTNDKPFRTTTRALATAEAIRDRVPFDTSGSLMGRTVTPGHYGSPWGHGRLDAENLAAYFEDAQRMDYMVWSYSTPIAWHLAGDDGGSWYIVNQSFSPTTSKHQGNLYLIPRANHEVVLVPVKGKHRWNVMCETCDTVLSGHEYKADAYAAQHAHRMNGRTLAGVR